MRDMKIGGVVAVIDDGIKDAAMYMDYAAKAKAAGDKESAAMFQAEAMKRINGAKDWYERYSENMKQHVEDFCEAYMERMEQKLNEVLTKVSQFK
jgi:rubrerythrin